MHSFSPILMRSRRWLLVCCMLGGCSTAGRTVDPSAYASMSCPELNEQVGHVSAEISNTAIVRGRIARTDIPRWIPGGRSVGSRLVDRQSTKIEEFQQRERALVAARDRNCRAG